MDVLPKILSRPVGRIGAAAQNSLEVARFGGLATDEEPSPYEVASEVRGLISIGVRQGEHVGVLMGARPSALALAVAISRLGAVAVLLRPDGDAVREAELGEVDRIIADAERASMAAGLGTVHTFVLGGGGAPRELGVPRTTDMEQIDPDAVPLPRWYRPNPGSGTSTDSAGALRPPAPRRRRRA